MCWGALERCSPVIYFQRTRKNGKKSTTAAVSGARWSPPTMDGSCLFSRRKKTTSVPVSQFCPTQGDKSKAWIYLLAKGLCCPSVQRTKDTNLYQHQGGRTWEPFVGSKNGNENFRQACINNFRVKCVVFARIRKFAKLSQ